LLYRNKLPSKYLNIDPAIEKTIKLQIMSYNKNLISPDHRPTAESEKTRTLINGYHNSNRIKRAKELLIHYNLTPIEVAYQLNYNSVEEFTNQFKSRVGLAPEHFKQLRFRSW
jgi:AraC-like DNA-binding protein